MHSPINEKEAMNFKESKELGFGGKKRKSQSYFNLKNKRGKSLLRITNM